MNKLIEKLEKWVQEELEPYFQGEFGTMDSMLELFMTQLREKQAELLQAVGEEIITEYTKNIKYKVLPADEDIFQKRLERVELEQRSRLKDIISKIKK